ncbi:hypothetical protein GCM10027084_02400 [Pseudoxanthomonas sangjuensis]
MAGLRPLIHMEQFLVKNLGEALEVPARSRQAQARFRGPGPGLGPRVYRREYWVAIRLERKDGKIVDGYPLSDRKLSRYQARKLLRRVRLTIPQAGIYVGQGVRP